MMARAMRVAPWRRGTETVEQRNRRTAVLLVGWIVLLCAVSVVVIWLRN